MKSIASWRSCRIFSTERSLRYAACVIGGKRSIPVGELRAVVLHVRELEAKSHRASRVSIWTYALLFVILLGSIRVGASSAYLSSSLQTNEESRMRTLQSLGVVSSIAIASVTTAQNAVQWRVEDGGNGHWYELVVSGSTVAWSTADANARTRGGLLACITSAAENSFVRSINPTNSTWRNLGPWLGGFQSPNATEPGGGWGWVSGEAWTWAEWTVNRVGEPNNAGCGPGNEDRLHFVACGTASPHWNDIPANGTSSCCGSELSITGYIIEWSSDCNNDGVVDYGQIRSGELIDTNANGVPDCCETTAGCGTTPVEWRSVAGGNGHWYQYVHSQTDLCWNTARQIASARGGHLATVTSAAENTFLRNLVLPLNPGGLEGGPYLGATCDGVAWGQWYWITGEPFSFSSWNGGEPSSGGTDRFVHFWRWSDLDWNDAPDCGALMRSLLVEWSADCNGDGIVDFGQIRAGQLADANGNNIPDCCEIAPFCTPCSADVDQSGAVNGVDLAAVLNNWGTSGGKQPRSDTNGDGVVDGSDLAEVLNAWGPCP